MLLYIATQSRLSCILPPSTLFGCLSCPHLATKGNVLTALVGMAATVITIQAVIRVKVFEQLVFEHKVFETDGIRKQMVFEQLKTCGIRNIQC